MAKKKHNKVEEPRQETRKEKRINAADRERNHKLYMIIGVVFGLAALVLLIGAVDQFVRKPNSPVATIGTEKVSTKEFQKRVRLQENQLLNQYAQMSQLEQQFGGQGFFTSQMAQIEATLSSAFSLGAQVQDQLIDESIIRQEAEKQGIVVSDEEVEAALREEVASAQGEVTESQATATAEAGSSATATAELWTPIPEPTLDVTNLISGTDGITNTTETIELPTPEPPPTRPILTDDSYQEGLSSLEESIKDTAGLSLDEYREIIRVRLLRDKLSEVIGEEEVETTEEQVNARHILLRVEEPVVPDLAISDAITGTGGVTGVSDITGTSDITGASGVSGVAGITETEDITGGDAPVVRDAAATLALAKELRQRILDGEDFGELAKEYSDDLGSGANGGDLGWFSRGAMVAPFDEAVFSLDVGEISEPVETQFGWHLIEVTDRDDARPKDEATLAQEKNQAFLIWLQAQVVDYNVDRAEDLSSRLPNDVGQGLRPLQQPSP